MVRPDAIFLDAPSSEIATSFILEQLHVKFLSSEFLNLHNKLSKVTFDDSNSTQEHKNLSEVYFHYLNARGTYIDVRDSADSWIRIFIEAGDIISIPPNLYHRFKSNKHDTDSSFYVVGDHDQALASPIKRHSEYLDVSELVKYHNYRELVCELCRQFFTAGWVTGTGGSISIRYGSRIYMTPSGVQKERIHPDDLFVLDTSGNILASPPKKAGSVALKLSDCAPLFLHAFQQRNAGLMMLNDDDDDDDDDVEDFH